MVQMNDIAVYMGGVDYLGHPVKVIFFILFYFISFFFSWRYYSFSLVIKWISLLVQSQCFQWISRIHALPIVPTWQAKQCGLVWDFILFIWKDNLFAVFYQAGFSAHTSTSAVRWSPFQWPSLTCCHRLICGVLPPKHGGRSSFLNVEQA